MKKIRKVKKVSVSIRKREKVSLNKNGIHYGVALVFSCLFIFFIGIFSLQKSVRSPFCANSISCIQDLSGKVSPDSSGVFMGEKVSAPQASYFSVKTNVSNVLGTETTSGAKHIYVDLTKQHLFAYQGNTLVYDFAVSTGKWNLTPTGTFYIWIKLYATRMTGGEGRDAYDLPNVPWTMYFANAQVGRGQGYSLHGAYWHHNFGHPMSHGCVNIAPANARLLFEWADPQTTGSTTYSTDSTPGTPVTIYGVTPNQDLMGTKFHNHNISPDAGT